MVSIITLFIFLAVLLAITFVFINIFLDITGAPFVPTKTRDIEEAFTRAKLKRGQALIDLGSGDGRAVFLAVEKYGVKGIGIEINPYLVVYSKILAKIKGLKNIEFKRQSIFETDLKDVDVIFLFLKPNVLQKLIPNLKTCKKGTIIIAQGFPIPGWDKFLTDKVERKVFSTYFYKIV